MSTYYRYVNYSKREVICLSSVTSIKYSAFACLGSLQSAVLNMFLGFGYDRFDQRKLDLSGYIGRWKRDRIGLEDDNSETTSGWGPEFDTGMLLLKELSDYNELDNWLEHIEVEGWERNYIVQQMLQWSPDGLQ